MTIKNDTIDVASAGIKAYKTYRKFKEFLFVSLAVLFLVAAIVFLFLNFIVWGIVFVVLTLIAFGISRFFAFTSKMLDVGLEKLQQYKDGVLGV